MPSSPVYIHVVSPSFRMDAFVCSSSCQYLLLTQDVQRDSEGTQIGMDIPFLEKISRDAYFTWFTDGYNVSLTINDLRLDVRLYFSDSLYAFNETIVRCRLE